MEIMSWIEVVNDRFSKGIITECHYKFLEHVMCEILQKTLEERSV